MTALATEVKDFYGVGEARRRLKCSEKRVRREFDRGVLSGDLNGRRGARRISYQSLIKRMTELQIPLGELAPADSSVAMVSNGIGGT